MLEISNTNEMNELLKASGESTLRFPGKANVFLDDIGLSSDAKQELDETARKLRRSLHRDRYTELSAKVSGVVLA